MEAIVSIDRLETFAMDLDHPEGIVLAPDGHLYVGGELGQLYRIEDDESITEITRTNGFFLGLAADAASRIYACDIKLRCVWRIDPKTGSRAVFAVGPASRPMVNPNWGCFDAHGNYYVSDSGHWKARDGIIWLVPAGGTAEVWTDESRDFPNGMALSPDGSTLYVAESTPGRLVQIAIRPDGTPGGRTVLADLPGIVPDGVAVAADGSLIIACYRPDVVLQWRADYGLRTVAEDPEGTVLAAPTNAVFVGPNLDVIVVPNIGRWHLTRIRAGIRGVPLFYPNPDLLGARD